MHFVLMAAQKYKVVIVLDAINQLSNEHNALSLCWLPTSLPKDFSVRIICSMIENDHQVLVKSLQSAFALFRLILTILRTTSTKY